MTTFQLNIVVNIGVTDELKQLLTSIFTCADPIGYTPTPIAANEVAPVKILTEDLQPTTEEEELAPAVAPTEKIYTERDVRDAMDRARRRIEGEDYKTNTTGELYTQWHHKLTAWFKQTAAAYGSDKPSTLPDSESRRKFIEECDLVHVSGSCLTVPLPY